MNNSIWNSIEANCWSRDFDYSNYLIYHAKANCKGETLSFEGYKNLCTLLNFEEDEKHT